jgi:uncharacterized protein (TIGR03118 family)
MFHRRVKWFLVTLLFAASAIPVLASSDSLASGTANAFQQTNLVSDLSGIAVRTDPHLVNPWGIAYTNTGSPFWISDNNAGVSTLYNVPGTTPPVTVNPLVVTVPLPQGGPGGTPTGVVFNGNTNEFKVGASGSQVTANFIFATEDGTIAGRAAGATQAIIAVDNSNNPDAKNSAVYKGLALASSGGKDYLYATNFRSGTVDVFDANFKQVNAGGKFSFNDPKIPSDFAPFGIQGFPLPTPTATELWVTYAKRDAAKHDDVAHKGDGFVDVFDTSGNLLRRFATRDTLNAPWGVAIAPAGFGPFSGDVLIGNFGDGHIGAFDRSTGGFLGQLQDPEGKTLAIDGLWGLLVGNGGNSGSPGSIYFTAGLDGESHGLFGALSPAP